MLLQVGLLLWCYSVRINLSTYSMRCEHDFMFIIIVVMETLTKLSTNTAVLEDPNCLSTLATASLRSADPTEIKSLDEEVSSSAPSTAAQASATQQQWNSPSSTTRWHSY